jgi:putative DNA primase/helicase
LSFLQRFCGYGLTGVTREECFLFLYGMGWNGKSKFINALAWAMGDYSVTAMADLFTRTKHDQHPTHVAALQGARLVSATETEEGKVWAEARIKSLTGSDPISCRFMHCDTFEFKPQFKVVLSGNHKPVLRNPDDAMCRRLNLVPMTFKPKTINHNLEAELQAEGGGILQWMIDGCLAWQREGLNRPSKVIAATAEYFAEQDIIQQWIDERCKISPQGELAGQEAYADFKGWAIERGQDPRTNTVFGGIFSRTYPKTYESRRAYVGVELLPRAFG